MGGEQRLGGGEWEGENALLYFNAVRGEVEQLSVTPASPPVTHTYIHAYIYTYIHTHIHTPPPPRLGSHAERLRGRGNAAGGGAPRRARPRANIGQQRHLAAAPRRSAAGLWGGGDGGTEWGGPAAPAGDGAAFHPHDPIPARRDSSDRSAMRCGGE